MVGDRLTALRCREFARRAARRAWLAELELPEEERETVDAGIRQIDFLDSEVEGVERLIATDALGSAEIKRLMTVPGVNLICAATFTAAIGDSIDAIWNGVASFVRGGDGDDVLSTADGDNLDTINGGAGSDPGDTEINC